jgi:hypothetical protein
MNFRRGFFRIWVILSSLFIIGVAFASYKEVIGEFEKASLDFSSFVIEVPVNCTEARGKSGTDYLEFQKCWYQMPTFRRLFPEYKDMSDDAVSDKLYAKAGIELHPARTWKALGIAISIALGVPLVALVIGAALGWAFSGFRSALSPSAMARRDVSLESILTHRPQVTCKGRA